MKIQLHHCRSAYDRPDYERLHKHSLGPSAEDRAEIATALLLNDHVDCRIFDNCFEMGDADQVIARLVAKARQHEPLLKAIQREWSTVLDADGYPAGWLEIHERELNPLGLQLQS